MDRTEKCLLLDTASLYFRAFYGVPESVTAPDGMPVNAVRGLLDVLARLVEDHAPSHVVACWDNDWRPQWRVDLVPSYKAHRVAATRSQAPDVEETPDVLEPQVPVIRACLQVLGIAVVGADGYEADDIIATLASSASRPVDVVTGDRDLFQLIDDARQVRVLYTARGVGRLQTMDEDAVTAKYDIPGRLYADFATLRGDPSDGLPGVPGVGEKTAAALVRTYGDLDQILAAVQDPTSGIAAGVRSKIRKVADQLPGMRKVVQAAREVDLPDYSDAHALLPTGPTDPDTWSQLVAEYGLGGSAERVLKALAVAGPGADRADAR